MLTFTDYQSGAARTAVYPVTHRITYPALGLAGETTEALQASFAGDARNVAAEIGDVMWYLAALCADCGTTLADVAGTDTIRGWHPSRTGTDTPVEGAVTSELIAAVIVAGRVAEHAKKMLRDRTDRRPQIVTSASVILEHLAWASRYAGTTLEAVCAANLAKLADRAARNQLGGDGDNR